MLLAISDETIVVGGVDGCAVDSCTGDGADGFLGCVFGICPLSFSKRMISSSKGSYITPSGKFLLILRKCCAAFSGEGGGGMGACGICEYGGCCMGAICGGCGS